MTTYNIATPYPVFTDPRGGLVNGKLYIGEAGKNPETYPVTVFNDKALSAVVPQPISLVQGVPVRNGAPTQLYTRAANISLTTRNQYGLIVQSTLNLPTQQPSFEQAYTLERVTPETITATQANVNFNNYVLGTSPFGVVANGYLQQTEDAALPLDIYFGFLITPTYTASDATIEMRLNLSTVSDFSFLRCYDSQTMFIPQATARPAAIAMTVGVSSIDLNQLTYLSVQIVQSGLTNLTLESATDRFTGIRYTRRS